jgi:hypothetical protein
MQKFMLAGQFQHCQFIDLYEYFDECPFFIVNYNLLDFMNLFLWFCEIV